MTQTVNVLVFARESDSLGGVVNYINVLKSNFHKKIIVTDFTIGHRKGQYSFIKNIMRPIVDGCRLVYQLTISHYDVIHLNPSLNRKSVLRDGFFLAILKLFHKENIVVFFHGWDDQFFSYIKKHSIYSSLFRNLFSCKKILVLASEFRRELIQLGFEEIKVEVATTMFSGSEFSGVSKKRDDNEFRILFLSRLITEKGLYELLDAFEELLISKDNLRLIIAGDGPEFENIKAMVERKNLEGKVCLPGYLRGREKANEMINADLFVLPTYHGEGCPVSLLEAMAAGLPIISSRVAAIPEIVENNRNGIILGSVSKEALVDSLNYCVSNPEFLSMVGENNRKKAWEKYEAAVVTDKMEKVYAEIVDA